MLDERLGLHDRTIVVAGGGGDGIGNAISRLLHAAGARVLAVDIAPGALQDVPYRTAVADVTDAGSFAAAIDGEEVLHGLVHVVGGLGGRWEPTETLTTETFDHVMRTNLTSALVTSQAVGARLLAQGGGGSIVHIASTAGMTALPRGASYAVAKAGMLALMRTQAVEWGGRGVRVNAVAVGSVRTPRNDADIATAIPLGRRGMPDDIANGVLFLLSDLASWVSGHALVVDGGNSARPSFLGDDDLPVFVR